VETCLRSRYSVLAVVYLLITRSLPSNRSTCNNATIELFHPSFSMRSVSYQRKKQSVLTRTSLHITIYLLAAVIISSDLERDSSAFLSHPYCVIHIWKATSYNLGCETKHCKRGYRSLSQFLQTRARTMSYIRPRALSTIYKIVPNFVWGCTTRTGGKLSFNKHIKGSNDCLLVSGRNCRYPFLVTENRILTHQDWTAFTVLRN
jgi:hypothetical protein